MYFFCDIETTGRIPWRHEILSLAGIVTDEKFNEIDRIILYNKPLAEGVWDEGAEKIHGITLERARAFPHPNDNLDRLDDFLCGIQRSGQYHFICHALPFKGRMDLFDRNFVFAWYFTNNKRDRYYHNFPEAKVRSTIIRSPKEAAKRWGVENQKLGTWARRLGIKLNHHEAVSDTECLIQVFKYQQGARL
jgi:DNA polymerase III epsilon subunit-like protein